MRLIIANKLYSSWSMRAWVLMRAFEIPFDEEVIPIRQSDTRERILVHSPSGKVPVLIDRDVTVWESLAIAEYLAEKFPHLAIWPAGSAARACARAVAAEMHAGFQPLRIHCPLNFAKRFAPRDRGDEVRANVARIEEMWRDARRRFGAAGPFLFGAFSAADAMYAPIASRFDTYQIEVSPETRAYMTTILAHPAVIEWRSAALREPWHIAVYEEGETAVEDFQETASQQ